MKKQTVAQGTLILLVAGFLNRILGMVNRIIVTRYLGDDGVGLYMLIAPTMMLLTTFASIGLPVAIPALISKATIRQKKILSASFIIAMICSGIISICLFFTAKPIALYLLKDERTYLPLISLGPLLFVISLSSILKGYFQGEQNMYPTAVSTFVEQCVRIGLCLFFISWLLPYGIVYAIMGTIWASICGEIASILILLIMFFKNMHHNHPYSNLKPTTLAPSNFKDILAISLPATGSRLIGSFTHFLEPILVVNCLFALGYSSEVSAKLYGAVAGFALPMLLMPTFITHAVSQSIVPVISKAHANKQYDRIHDQLSIAFRLSFLPGGFATLLFMLFPDELMNLLYDTSTGAQYLRIMAPFFLLFYFQGILTATLQAINKASKAMFATLVSSVIKVMMMTFLLQVPTLHINGLVIAILFNLILTTYWDYLMVKKAVGYSVHISSLFNALLTLGITFISGKCLIFYFPLPLNLALQLLVYTSILLVIYLGFLFVANLLPAKQLSTLFKR